MHSSDLLGSFDPLRPAPTIASPSKTTKRTFWSVMIPTFNCASFLKQTLESVLAQDPGIDQMEIEVVDDCSSEDDPQKIVESIAPQRVRFFRKQRNEGAISNFNTCIERASGHYVHILHGDDFVLPNFYSRVRTAATTHPTVAAFFTRCLIVNEKNELETMSPRIHFLEKPSKNPDELLKENLIYTPSVVINRDFYLHHGGFRPDLVHVADWEMWLRAIYFGKGLFLNEPLATYRSFVGNDSSRLIRTGENIRDMARLAEILDLRHADFDKKQFLRRIQEGAYLQYRRFLALGDVHAADANRRLWTTMTTSPQRIAQNFKSLAKKLMGK